MSNLLAASPIGDTCPSPERAKAVGTEVGWHYLEPVSSSSATPTVLSGMILLDIKHQTPLTRQAGVIICARTPIKRLVMPRASN